MAANLPSYRVHGEKRSRDFHKFSRCQKTILFCGVITTPAVKVTNSLRLNNKKNCCYTNIVCYCWFGIVIVEWTEKNAALAKRVLTWIAKTRVWILLISYCRRYNINCRHNHSPWWRSNCIVDYLHWGWNGCNTWFSWAWGKNGIKWIASNEQCIPKWDDQRTTPWGEQ